MKQGFLPTSQASFKELIKDQFEEWCVRNGLQIPDNPLELLNDEGLTAAQKQYVWSVLEFLN